MIARQTARIVFPGSDDVNAFARRGVFVAGWRIAAAAAAAEPAASQPAGFAALDGWITHPELFLRAAAGVEPDSHSLPDDLHARGRIGGGHADVEKLAVVEELDR